MDRHGVSTSTTRGELVLLGVRHLERRAAPRDASGEIVIARDEPIDGCAFFEAPKRSR